MMIGKNLMGKGSDYPCTLKVTGQFCENQKKREASILVTTSTSFHLAKSVSIDLMIQIQL